jgi:putative heme-binding domain-containing protein
VSSTRAIVQLAVGVAFALGAGRAGAQGTAPAGGQGASQDHSGQYAPAEIALGARVYSANCANCHGVTGAGVANIDLRRGPLPRAATEAALRGVIAKGFPTTGMPGVTLQPDEMNGLVAFIRSGFEAAPAAPAGAADVARGQLLFEGRGKCLSCHRVNDRGSFSGPELTEIGRVRTAAAIQRSLLDPTGSMMPINRPVRAVTRDGKVISGRRLNEDTFTVQLMNDQGRLVSLVKSELKEWTVGTTSPMPTYKDTFAPGELADLVAYVFSLKGVR